MRGTKIVPFYGKGENPWYYRIVAANGETVAVSEGYSRRWNRNRAVKRLAKLLAEVEIAPEITP